MMKLFVKVALVSCVLALACGSAALAVGKPEGAPPYGHPAGATGHSQKAPGQICKGKSKKHVKGEKGTAFSRCVKKVVAQRKEERKKEKEAAA